MARTAYKRLPAPRKVSTGSVSKPKSIPTRPRFNAAEQPKQRRVSA